MIVLVIVLCLSGIACGFFSRGASETGPEREIELEGVSGEEVFRNSGCSGCHNGVAGIAPSLEGLYGEEVSLESGETIIADEEYLRESIRDPKAKIVQGYQPVMPDFQDQLSEAQIESLIQYIISMGN